MILDIFIAGAFYDSKWLLGGSHWCQIYCDLWMCNNDCGCTAHLNNYQGISEFIVEIWEDKLHLSSN